MNPSLSASQFGSGASAAGGANFGSSPLDPSKTQGLSGPLGSSGTPGAIGNSSSGLTGSFGMGAGGMGAGGLGM